MVYRPQAEVRNWLLLPEGSDPRQTEKMQMSFGDFYQSVVKPLEEVEKTPFDALTKEHHRAIADCGGGLILIERNMGNKILADTELIQGLKNRIVCQRVRCGFEERDIPGDIKEWPKPKLVT